MTSSPISEFPELAEGQASAEVTVNEACHRIESLSALKILDRNLTAPPGSESDGDAYIVGGSATGAWATHDGDIAVYYGGYLFITPAGGMKCYVHDEKQWYGYSSQESAWHPLQRTWSTTEYWTGEYFGGSKLYAKTIDVGALPNATSSTDAHGISPVTIVRIIGTADNGTNQIPLPHFATAGVEIYVDDTNINLVTTTDLSGYSGYVTLEYTKA